ncbi:Rho termination factor N-terminal domain-containing protein [Sporosarcina sp. FSL K6-5500]|uniref:Rho termination factor N-terminal domain-containing protein n=1 Tax=Sporosarcina sp. FSL K6-5500 TaxID=2921558 RepID=UPI0030FD0F73
MIVETRKTANGTEYWDTELKKSVFVPAGKKPDFEITVDPPSMLSEPDGLNPGIGIVDESEIYLEDMTPKQLRAYAAELKIEIPSHVKKKDDIINLLSEPDEVL